MSYGNKTFDAYVDRHLSFQWKDANVKKLAQDFKARVLASRHAT